MGASLERCVQSLSKVITLLLTLVCVYLTLYLVTIGVITLGVMGSSYFTGVALYAFWIIFGVQSILGFWGWINVVCKIPFK